MNPYRQRVWKTFEPILAGLEDVKSTLDYGSGDGWITRQMFEAGFTNLTALEVQERPGALFEPMIYDGARIPFDDGAFDLVYTVDVLHHCPRPRRQLEEILRVAGRYLLIKDHTYSTPLGKIMLCTMDEIGNRKFGIPCLYHYQRGWEWAHQIERAGFKRRTLIHPAPCHVGLHGRATNAFEWIGLWERSESP